MEVQMRGLQSIPAANGVYSIKPSKGSAVKTYCDLTSQGGGWTLVVTSKTHSGWTTANVKQRNPEKPSLDADYSILGFADLIKDFDALQFHGNKSKSGKFDGGLSEWSPWDKCDKLCTEGLQRRHRYCTNPKPRCGGNDCSVLNQQTTEMRACYSCDESPIKSYGGYCVQPTSGDCSPGEGSHLILRKADSSCSAPYMNFVIDSDGVIHHKCSGKVICPGGYWPGMDYKLLLRRSCPLGISKHKRRVSLSLQNTRNNYCVHARGGWPGEGVALVYWNNCDMYRVTFHFFQLRKY
ncbi:predicted protein [Nematostella vectensis]|uniref:Fibrinogen C-terminal domain-containing protein n=1 Tax=Nematostella vectensis TaxID=45351 RepID=A7SVB6_NEMVE|nr:predicted protein [Nematostella vectensis]|eukprot:XP_001624433.1 predicted protein [Nematostella vectensis]